MGSRTPRFQTGKQSFDQGFRALLFLLVALQFGLDLLKGEEVVL